jgi:lysophospholipase L1-like esterase
MMKFCLTFAIFVALASSVRAVDADYTGTNFESIEWCDTWIAHANETNLPRVLLIGDSITRAYYPQVEKNLAGKAYVGRMSGSAFISDPILLKEIAMVLDEYKFDVIHFNNGMHGWQHSEAEYEKAFPKFLTVIEQHAPHAKLIWANTTPLRVSPSVPAGTLGEATDERIAARNAIALKFVQAKGIPVDDLNTPMQGHPELHVDNVHFNQAGIKIQAAQVASEIEQALKN